MGLCPGGGAVEAEALSGGVSSDIWRVRCAGRSFCVKRALPQLKVAAEWRAPVERNAMEVAWLRTLGALVPGVAPEILGEDREAGLFAMAWLDPEQHRLWKAELLAGIIDRGVAAAVGERLGRVHAATAGRADMAERFATDHIFHPIRLEPYLLATAERRPEVAGALRDLAQVTASTKRAVAHGDVSPKNIVLGPSGPVFLDAECAWYGDPAFDVAFCLNHLLLKCLVHPGRTGDYLAAFTALAEAYVAHIDWEDPAGLEARAARLLPGLFLARVDGKSPVEYLTAEADQERVRRTAIALLRRPPARLAEIRAAWGKEMTA